LKIENGKLKMNYQLSIKMVRNYGTGLCPLRPYLFVGAGALDAPQND